MHSADAAIDETPNDDIFFWGGGGGGGGENYIGKPSVLVAPFEFRSIVYAPQIPYKWAPDAGINIYAHFKSQTQ